MPSVSESVYVTESWKVEIEDTGQRLDISNQDDDTPMDMLDGDLKLRERSWTVNTPSPRENYGDLPMGHLKSFDGYQIHEEEFDLVAASNPVTGGAYNDLEDLFEAIRQYHSDFLVEDHYWLNWNVENERHKRALLYGADLEYLTGIGFGPMMPNAGERSVGKLSLRRHPIWESSVPTRIMTSTGWDNVDPKNSMSWGRVTPIFGIPGNLPARLELVKLWGNDTDSADEIFLGIRPKYRGFSGFNPVLELEWGTAETDTSVQAEVQASNGEEMVCTFATTETMAKRCTLNLYEQGLGTPIDPDHYVGRYSVFLRASSEDVSADSQYAIKMLAGTTLGDTLVEFPPVYVDTTEATFTPDFYYLLEMGEVQLPPAGFLPGAAIDLEAFQWEIWAERLAGTQDLRFDSLLLMPSKHICHLKNVAVYEDDYFTYLSVDPRGLVRGWTHSGDYPQPMAGWFEIADNKWYLPTGDSIMVSAARSLAGSGQYTHTLVEDWTMALTYYPRWRSYRGT